MIKGDSRNTIAAPAKIIGVTISNTCFINFRLFVLIISGYIASEIGEQQECIVPIICIAKPQYATSV